MNKEKKIIKTRTSTMWIDEDGILHSVYSEGMDVELDDVKENMGVLKQLTGGKRAPYIIDIRGVHSVTREARDTASTAEALSITNSTALLIGSPISRVIGNFFMGLNKPPYPLRLFTSEEKAMAWLKGFVEKE